MFCAGLFSMCRSPAFYVGGVRNCSAYEYKSAEAAPEAPEPPIPAMAQQYKASLTFSTLFFLDFVFRAVFGALKTRSVPHPCDFFWRKGGNPRT
jgi:hypothetical protein